MTFVFRVSLVFIFLLVSACKNEAPIDKWEGGVVPYYLSGNFTDTDVGVIHEAMKRWESVAAVTFKEVSPRAGVYKIQKINETEWSSSIGENNSECHMIFGSGGDALSHVTHELGHGLGLLHEHQRPDRDRYVRVIWDKIIGIYKHNFDIEDNPLIVEESFPYDYHSIMHYDPIAFSIDSSDTMQSVDASHEIDRLGIITDIDSAKIQAIYGPPKTDSAN